MARRVLDVFLSSTAMDLAAHRAAVHARLMRTGLFHCVRQEDFGARDAGAVDYCRQEAQKADLFVGLVGLRRGWEPDGDNERRSITEMEHDWAREAGRRRYMWVAPDDFPVPGNIRENDEQHGRQVAFRVRVMGAGERIVSQKGFGTPDLLASEIVEHLLAQLVTSDLITQLRPELAHPDAGSFEEQAPAVAAAVEKLADDKDVDLLALARDPRGADLADLEAKLRARAEEHEAEAGRRAEPDRKASAEYWRHAGALARLHSPTKALAAYTKATELDPDDSDAWLERGQLAIETGGLAAAEHAYQSVLRLKTGTAQDRDGIRARLGMGDIALQRGSLAQAIEAYRSAQADAARFTKADPANAGWQPDLSASQVKIGNVLVAQGNLPAALDAFKDSLAIRERLVQADPANASWQRGLAVSHYKIGDVLMDQGKLAEALNAFKAALAIAERLAKVDPANAGRQRDLSVSHNKIGDALHNQGNLAAALAAYQASLAIAERLAKADPGNAEWQRDLSVSHNNIGDALRHQGNLPTALDAFNASYAIFECLANADPGNARWQRDLAISKGRIAAVLAQQDARDEALLKFREGRAVIVRLRAQAPDNAILPKDIAWFDLQISSLGG